MKTGIHQCVAAIAVTIFAVAAIADDGKDISRINKSISIEANQQAGELDTVNGSIRVGDNAVVESAGTVNGSIKLGEGAMSDSLSTVNGSITIGARAKVSQDTETVNGGISLGENAEVGGNVETVNGTIKLTAAKIGGGISTVSGNIDVGANSVVAGNIVVEENNSWSWGWFSSGKERIPRVVIGANAVVKGKLEFKREVELYVHDSAEVGKIIGAKAQSFSGESPQ